jgi:NAD(P)H-flavin reductase
MEFSKPQKYTARVSDKYYATDNEKFVYIKFELILPDRISYQAGQYISLKISEEGERRSYSIGSTPDDNHGFHLLIELVEEGGKQIHERSPDRWSCGGACAYG